MSQVISAFQPAGPEVFNKMICQMAPYFSTITPEFVDLKPGYTEAKVTKCREIQNHIGIVHQLTCVN